MVSAPRARTADSSAVGGRNSSGLPSAPAMLGRPPAVVMRSMRRVCGPLSMLRHCRTPIAGNTSTHTPLPGSHRASWVTWSANRDGAIDRHGVAEQVQNRAVLIDCCRKLLVALGRLRPGDAYLDPDS